MRLRMRVEARRSRRLVSTAAGLALSLLISQSLLAQSTTAAVYQTPDQAIVDVVDVLPTPSVRLGPDQEWMDRYVKNGPTETPTTD